MRYLIILIALPLLSHADLSLSALKSKIEQKCGSDINCKISSCNHEVNLLRGEFKHHHYDYDYKNSRKKEDVCMTQASSKNDYQCSKYIYSMGGLDRGVLSFRTMASQCYHQYWIRVNGGSNLADYNGDGKGKRSNRNHEELQADYKGCVEQAQNQANQYLQMSGCSQKVNIDFSSRDSWQVGNNQYTFGIGTYMNETFECKEKWGHKGKSINFNGLELKFPFLRAYDHNDAKRSFGQEELPSFQSSAYNTYAQCRVNRCESLMEEKIVLARNALEAKASQCGFISISEMDKKRIDEYIVSITDVSKGESGVSASAANTQSETVNSTSNNNTETANQSSNQQSAEAAEHVDVGTTAFSFFENAIGNTELPASCQTVVPELMKTELKEALDDLERAQKKYNEAIQKINSFKCMPDVPPYSCN